MDINIFHCIETDCIYFKKCKRNPSKCGILKLSRKKRKSGKQ